MPKILDRLFPRVDSFKRSPLAFLNFQLKVFLAIAVFAVGIVVLVTHAMGQYQKLYRQYDKMKQINIQLASVKNLKSEAGTILYKCLASTRNQKSLELGNSITNFTQATDELTVKLGDRANELAATSSKYIQALNYYSIFEMNKVHYRELKDYHNQLRKSFVKLENQLERESGKQIWRPGGMILFIIWDLFWLAIVVLAGGWIFIKAVKSITTPVQLISRHFEKSRAGEEGFDLSISSFEGLGMTAANLKAGESVWRDIFSEIKEIVKKLEEQGSDLIAGIKVQEISEVQIYEAHKAIDSYVSEQMKTSEKAKEQLQFLVANLASLQKIPQQLNEFVERIQGLLTEMETNLAEVLQAPLVFKDSSYIIRALFEDLSYTAAKINEVISILNEVSGQAELLSFNTAIEAARAGSHGLGFGVVSREIAKLVERSKKSAVELNTIISQVQTEINQVNELLPQAIINAETATGYQEAVMSICTRIFETTRSSIDDLLKLIRVFEDIVAKSSEITKESNLISALNFEEKEKLDQMELEIIDYQLNVKEAVRIAGKIGESVYNLKQSLVGLDV